MKTAKEKTRYFITPRDKSVSDKWTLLRNLARKTLSHQAQLKLEWIIFYYTQGRKNAKLTSHKCEKVLPGTTNFVSKIKDKQSKTEKRPERPYGGVLCSKCMRDLIVKKARARGQE